MTERFSPSQILRTLHAGPDGGTPPTAHQVKVSAARFPDRYRLVMIQLHYKMVERQFKSPGKNIVTQYKKWADQWRGGLTDEISQFFLGAVDTYHEAAKGRFFELDWEKPERAPALARRMINTMPDESSIAGLVQLLALGQFQSTYSRADAAATLAKVQQHPHVSLVADFFWDTGALTYYSEEYVQSHRRDLPSLSEMQTWQAGESVGSERAIVISMDPNFFRIYAPMILFNAQQLPEQDFVIVICAPQATAQELHRNVESYLAGLTELNKQPAPSNIRFHAVDTPSWVGNEQTFYACARFLVIPELLDQYESVYTIDADLFMQRDPKQFLERTASMILGFPKTEGLLGVPPWRRFMAGNLVANKKAKDSEILRRFFDYLSVGLAEPKSWMLDQNALTYSAEIDNGEYTQLTVARPMVVGPIMANWERNFKTASQPTI